MDNARNNTFHLLKKIDNKEFHTLLQFHFLLEKSWLIK
jgi:hypothetical protein